jgi:ribosomal protein S16
MRQFTTGRQARWFGPMAFLLAAALVLPVSGCRNYGTELTFNKGQLFYTDAVTEAEAKKLGQFLTDIKYFDGREVSVQLNKTGATYEIRLVVKEGAKLTDQDRSSFQVIALRASRQVFAGAPVHVHVCDQHFKTLEVIKPWQQLVFKKGELFYTAAVTEAEAKKLGNLLTDLGFFNDQEKSVKLDKAGAAYEMRLVLKKGTTVTDQLRAGYKLIAAAASAKVFANTPVHIHLCDEYFKTIEVVKS